MARDAMNECCHVHVIICHHPHAARYDTLHATLHHYSDVAAYATPRLRRYTPLY